MTGPKRVTPKQLAANRRNALKSTGPRTPEGKAVSRYNALTHGILAQAVIPEALEPYESRADFDRLTTTLAEAFAPANAIEELLVQQIALAYWRLARLYRAEAGSIARRQSALEADQEIIAALEAWASLPARLASGDRAADAPGSGGPEDRAVARALRSLPVPDTALKYARYERDLQHQLDRALFSLERLQRRRGGEFVAPPMQIEITDLSPPHRKP